MRGGTRVASLGLTIDIAMEVTHMPSPTQVVAIFQAHSTQPSNATLHYVLYIASL
ncbi:hypothetical protein A2U01_0074486, partial [Trifolium medium]|nr:hypothetical protein [Trifolium medium]